MESSATNLTGQLPSRTGHGLHSGTSMTNSLHQSCLMPAIGRLSLQLLKRQRASSHHQLAFLADLRPAYLLVPHDWDLNDLTQENTWWSRTEYPHLTQSTTQSSLPPMSRKLTDSDQKIKRIWRLDPRPPTLAGPTCPMRSIIWDRERGDAEVQPSFSCPTQPYT